MVKIYVDASFNDANPNTNIIGGVGIVVLHYDYMGNMINEEYYAKRYTKKDILALLDFVNDKFPDLHGNYYSDLSNKAQHKFLNSDVISYASLGESATDEDVIETFLMVNFTGKIMSQEHIDYVKEISKQI